MRTTRLTLATLSLAIPFVVMADPAAAPNAANKFQPPRREPTTLVEKVKAGTPDAFKNPFMAMTVGWRNRIPCTSGPDEGAAGIYLFFDPSPIAGQPPQKTIDGILEPFDPEALIYEPTGVGTGFRLVGAAFIETVDSWNRKRQEDSTLPPTPRVDGHLMNYVPAPNRYGLPAFYELHVWAYAENPRGTFADFNPLVSCNRAKADDLPNSDVFP
jgi:hypothetical protein